MQQPKIKIEVSHNDLCIVNDVLAFVVKPSINNRESKVIRSVLIEIYTSFVKKAIEKAGTRQKIKITLKYFQAHFLEQLLIETNNRSYIHEIQTVINQLNQKLA